MTNIKTNSHVNSGAIAVPNYSLPGSTSMSLVGSYVVLQINPVAMVAGYADLPILAVARALGTGRYVALVQKEMQIPAPAYAPHWRTYRVTFVGPHKGDCSDRCVPIFPHAHDTNKTMSVTPSMEFPFARCCHWLSTEALIRVRTHPRLSAPHWTLSDGELNRFKTMRWSESEPWWRTLPATSRCYAECGGSATPEPSQYNKRHGAIFSPPSEFKRPRAREHTSSPSSGRTHTPVSELFDCAGAQSHRPDVSDSMSEYSATSTEASSVAEEQTPTVSSTGELTDVDCPLVDVSFDLRELQEIVDPRGFLEERTVVLQLVEKARLRGKSEETLTVLSEPLPVSGVQSRMNDLDRVRSDHSAPTEGGRRRPRVLTRRPPAGQRPLPQELGIYRNGKSEPGSDDKRSAVLSTNNNAKRRGVLCRSVRFVCRLYKTWIPSYKERKRKGAKLHLPKRPSQRELGYY